MTFLPQDYEVPTKSNGFMKFEKGANTFRILSSPIIGWEYWIEDSEGKRKPVRTRMNEEHPEESKHFWAMCVWNYKAKCVQILEITQAGIQKSIKALIDNPKWGKPFDYDISVTRQGDKLETEYSVMPEPKEELSQEIKAAYTKAKINLEALYEGGNPFDDGVDADKVIEGIKKGVEL